MFEHILLAGYVFGAQTPAMPQQHYHAIRPDSFNAQTKPIEQSKAQPAKAECK